MRIEKYGNTRYWAVVDITGQLVCLCIYRKGATEVVRRFQTLDLVQERQHTNHGREDISNAIVVSERGRVVNLGAESAYRALSSEEMV
jgi:hypothetical protein